MAVTPNMSLSLPTPGPGGTAGPTWASMLNTAFEAVDEHDHSTGKGVKVTPSGLNINANLSMGSHDLFSTRSLRLDSQAAVLSTATDVRNLYSVNGELYYNDAVGNNVQITSSGSVAGATGTIGGMGGTTASVTYSNVTKSFTFLQAGGQTAKIVAGEYLLYETATATNAVTLKSPTGLAASYNCTFPTATPADTKIMTMNTSGDIVLANNAMVPIGTILPFYDFNGTLTFDANYFAYCDGSSVSFAGIGSQTTPDLSNRYLVGFGTEGGGDIDTAAWATAAVGNADHETDISHTHGPGTLQFAVGRFNFGSSWSYTVYNSAGSGSTLVNRNISGGTNSSSDPYISMPSPGSTFYTYTLNSQSTGSSESGGSVTQDIQPRSVRVRYIIRTN